MKGQRGPKVSICIPTYNYGRFIADAIGSALSQTFDDFELLVVDNCSADNTREIVESYAARDERVSYYRNDANLGMVGNWNRCLDLARGDYIKILCADDVLEPDCLEQVVHVLETSPQVSLVASGRILVDSSLKYIKKEAYSADVNTWPGAEVITRCLFYGNYIGEPTAVLFRRQAALRGFNTAYGQLIDLEMWFHLLEQGDFAIIPDGLCKLRQHRAQQSKDNRQAFSFLQDEYNIYETFVSKPYVIKSVVNSCYWNIRMAYYIWRERAACANRRMLHSMIARHINPYLFYLVCPVSFFLNKLNKLLRY